MNFAKRFLTDCNKFLIVGTSGLDGDLMELLRESLHRGRAESLHIVDYRGGAETTLKNFLNEGLFSQRFPHGDSDVLFKRGFKDYVAGPGIRDFAEY